MDRSMRKTLMKLIEKIPQEEGKIDEYLKEQIERALTFYSSTNLRQKNKILWKDDNTLLEVAKKKLQSLPAENKNIQHRTRTVKEMRKYLLGLQKVIKKAKPEECAEVMDRAISYAKDMERTNLLREKDRNHISTLFLQLFLLILPTKVTKFLDEALTKLYDAHSDLSRCDTRKVNLSSIQNIRTKLTEVTEVIEVIKRTSNQILNKIEKKLFGGNPDHVLDEISTEIEKYSARASSLPLSVSEDTVKTIKEKLSHLKERLDKVPTKTNTIQNKKKQLNQKIGSILESLGQMNHDLTLLINAETKVSAIIEANEDFTKKKTSLEVELKRIHTINTVNKAIKVKVSQFVNRISGFILVEGMHYLRHKLEVIEDYKSYAQQFAYPKRIKMYDVKKKEIASVSNSLDCSPEDNFLFKTRIDVINSRVQKALTLLEKRADENDKTIYALEKLITMKQEISNHERNPKLTLYVFNDFRNRIQAIEDFTFKVIQNKLEVLQQLHHFEIEIYKKHFPNIAPAVEEHLHTYESLTQELNILNKTEIYLTSQTIRKGRTSMKALIQSKIDLQNVNAFHQLFKIFFDQMEQLAQKRNKLDSLAGEMDTINNDLKELSRSNVSNTERIRSFNALEERANLLKVNTTRIDLFKKLLQVRENIRTERAKIEVNETLSSRINQIKANIKTLNSSNISIDANMKIVEEVLILKERIEDLPDGNVDLDSQKQSILQQLCSVLTGVDQTLAKTAFTKRQYENVLNVENYFNKFEFDDTNKETVQFVRKIFSHAKTFEDTIECYFGSRESVDFYIIHENLLRCLDELDQLKCDDDILLDETINAMKYIKLLKSQLLKNAYRVD